MTITAGFTTAVANPATSEQALTIAFLYNFLKFAEWPEGTVTDALTLCVADSVTFDQELEALAGRKIQDKTLRIKRIELEENPRTCQLLFIPREEKPVRLQEWLKNTARLPILMVSNKSEFLDMGGMIVLIDDGNHLQFDVNLTRAKNVGLQLNAQLLQIARDVRGK
jgi:hypothetical protein